MTATPAGREVGLYLDTAQDIAVGDFVVTPTGRTYHLIAVRQQTRGQHVGRWHIRAVVVDPAVPGEDDVVHRMAWYSRRRRAR